MATYNRENRRVPVISTGGSVHVTHVIGDIRTISVNGGEHCGPDQEGNINILVPPIIEVDTELDTESTNPVENQAVAQAIADMRSDTASMLRLFIPIEVASEEAMERLIESGQVIPGQMYYVAEN